MTTEGMTAQPADENERRWWTLLRRAFGIPDIVSTGNRQVAVAHALLDGLPLPPETSDFEKRLPSLDHGAAQNRQVLDATNVIATIASMGGAGKLDELFLVAPRRPDEDALRQLVASRTATLETKGLIEKAFEKITAYVRAHPFEN